MEVVRGWAGLQQQTVVDKAIDEWRVNICELVSVP